MDSEDVGSVIGCGVVILYILVWLCAVIGIIWVAAHFIGKYW